jgi:hypothetical protein
MGTDVHAVFQTKLGRRWVEVPSAWEQDRHYLLFSWLAGVRNGFGFGGIFQVDTPATVTDKTTHVSISWIETENPFAYFIDEVRKLKEAHGNVRMVFGFDS